jgi:hypothetical protein
MASAIWSPTRYTGSSAFIALCGMSEISFQRIRRISSNDSSRSRQSPNRIRPPSIRPPGGSRRRRARATVVFPHPDSPTRPKLSRARTPNDTPSTARTAPSRVW